MKSFLHKILFAVLFSAFCYFSMAQSYNMSNSTVTTCSGTFYDSGGTGNYSSSQDLTYTICPSSPGSKVRLNFTAFNVEANYDYLTIYDGPNTGSPTLGTYDNDTPLSGIVQATNGNASGCLTFVFHSDGSVEYSGWVATISCTQPCQTVQAVLASSTPAVSGQYINICQGQTVLFNGSANYPQNGTSYTQSNATSTFAWNFGDGTTATGQSVSHTYNNGGGYQVGLVVTDVNGCVSSNVIDIRVRVSTTPVFAGTNANPTTICVGQNTTLTGVATPTPWSQPTGAILAGTTFLPDGSGVSYTTGLNFTNFSPGQTVSSVNDIVSVCLNMEHTYMGDLQISLSCPNGSSIVLLPYSNSGGGTILGEPVGQDLPVDGNSSNTTPGIGYDYCFSPTSTSGYIDNAANWTTVAPYTDPIGQVSTSVQQANAGTYQAYGAWTSLVGCPLNGTWTITVTDNLGLDNGYIFSWGVNFSPSLYPSLWGFTPTIVSNIWSGPGLAPTGTNPVTVGPTTTGTNTYTYSVTDNYGCTYDTTVTVTVNPGPTITVTPASASICSGASTTLTASGASSYSWMPGSLTGATVSVSPTNTTTYTVTGTSATGCIGSTTVTVTVKPNPVITPTATPASICVGTSSSLSATSSVAGTTYAWMPGSLSGSPVSVSPTTNTTYTVTGTAAGCSGNATVTVSISPNAVISANASPASICPGNSSTLSASGASTYSWMPGSLSGTSVTVSPTVNTTYTVTGTTATGCTGNTTVTVSINPNPAISANASPTSICQGSSTTLTASGANTYVWMPGSLNGTTVSVSPSAITTYSVTGTDAAGCTGSTTVTVSMNPNAVISATASPASICLGTSSTLTASGASTYTWMPGALSGTTVTVTPTVTTIYTVSGTTAAGCTGANTITVTVKPLPTVTAVPNQTYCAGVTAPMTSLSGPLTGTTFAWSNSNAAVGLGSGGPGNPPAFTATNTTASSITSTVTVTPTLNGCVGTVATYTITVNPSPVATVPLSFAVCHGDVVPASAFTSATTGAVFSWTNSQTSIGLAASGSDNVPSFTASNPGITPVAATIAVTATANSCTGTPATYTITVNPLPVITFSVFPQLCTTSPAFNLAQASPAGGTYTGAGITGATFDPAVAGIGTHTVVYDYTNPVTGCSNTDSSTIEVMGALNITVTPNSPYICPENSILLMANGAYTFEWLPADGLSSTTGSNVVATPAAGTTYTVTGTNPDGCVGSTTVTVGVYTIPVLAIFAEPKEGCSPLDVHFSYGPVGTIDTNTMLWNFGDLSSAGNTSAMANPSHIFNYNGNYPIYLTALTPDGCPVSAIDTVRAFIRPVADFYNNPEVAYSDNPQMTFIELSSNAITWTWDFGDPGSYNYNTSSLRNPVHIFSDSGTYVVQLIVSSSQSCADTVSKPVKIYPEILVYIPNAFTPNDDGLNEAFKPVFTGIDPNNYDFYIFDRWGNIQFHSNDPEIPWDGKNNEKLCESGVYVYFIIYHSVTGKKFKLRGNVTLVR
ncbi:MAG TPA: PKD domain-containing protein [Bacteroidales bacterium]|nr:PKD domain-containing protein [Bacteroidales bacterium]HPI30837.1 PKD domain-containing protein [Bacteroidales bacterium]HQN16475.1 PKD domain-containing protein [Bacteroidales bacterium]HQP16361.1 PKD domain-containing protein [Bacteroidales bacterium]